MTGITLKVSFVRYESRRQVGGKCQSKCETISSYKWKYITEEKEVYKIFIASRNRRSDYEDYQGVRKKKVVTFIPANKASVQGSPTFRQGEFGGLGAIKPHSEPSSCDVVDDELFPVRVCSTLQTF